MPATSKVLCFLVFVFLYSCGSQKSEEPMVYRASGSIPNDSVVFAPSEEVRSKYDTLIPLFDGLYLSYFKPDTSILTDFQASEDAFKWGVIDANGRIVVPFKCDGIKAISEHKGVASVYKRSYSLNTGVPRYVYEGAYFFFTKEGEERALNQDFSFTVEGIADFHRLEFVVFYGPEFYLPIEYKTIKPF